MESGGGGVHPAFIIILADTYLESGRAGGRLGIERSRSLREK